MAEQIELKDRTQTIQQARSYYYCRQAMSDQCKSHFQLSVLYAIYIYIYIYMYDTGHKRNPLFSSDNIHFFPRYTHKVALLSILVKS